MQAASDPVHRLVHRQGIRTHRDFHVERPDFIATWQSDLYDTEICTDGTWPISK